MTNFLFSKKNFVTFFGKQFLLKKISPHFHKIFEFKDSLQTCHELMLNLFWRTANDAKDENWKNTKTN
jgi:hypothetical protein